MIEKDILCALSGGGFRAMFYHAGVLRGLIRLGMKDRIKVISSVSGGSITNALFGLEFDKINSVEDFDTLVLGPLMQFSKKDPRNILLRYRALGIFNSIISGTGKALGTVGKPLTWLALQRNSELLIEQLDEYIFNGRTLNELSKNVRTVINATNLNNGARFRFDNKDFGDYKTGYSEEIDHIKISEAVMASACYPGLFSPMKLDIGRHRFYLRDRFKRNAETPNMVPEKVYLCDGGLFDNLGYYSIKSELDRGRQGFVIISDAANRFMNDNKSYGVINSLLRISDILMEQVSNRDRTRIVDNLTTALWSGVYFKLENSCRTYREYVDEKSANSSEMPNIGWSDDIVSNIAHLRTDLDKFSDYEINALVFHGETTVETIIAKWHFKHYKHLCLNPAYTPAVQPVETPKIMLGELKNSHRRFLRG